MKKLLPIFTVLCAQWVLIAQENPGTNRVVLTPKLVNELADEARTNNAALWAARSRVKAAEENAKSIPRWRDPEVMLGGMAAETMMREEDGDIMYGVEQMLPVFGKEKAAQAAARAMVPVEEADLEYRFQTVRKNLAQALFKAVLADEMLVLSEQDLAWLQTLVAGVEQRYAVGDASQVEVLRAQNERSRRLAQISNEENEREAAYAQVNRLLNRNVIAGWSRMELPDVYDPIPLTTKLLQFAEKFEPQLRMMRQQRAQSESMVNMARKERRPDLTAGVEARQYSRTGEGRSAAFLLKMTLPFFNRDKYKAAERREEARVEEMDYRIEDMVHQLRTEVHHLVAIIDTARREALLYRDEIIPRSEQALRSAEAAWQSSRDAFRDVLEGRRMLLEARAMYFKAVAEQYTAISELIVCCGIGDLEALEMLTTIKEEEAK
jgi:outer membrane protein, heavy metal efflux system